MDSVVTVIKPRTSPWLRRANRSTPKATAVLTTLIAGNGELTAVQVAARCNCTVAYVYNIARDNKLTFKRIDEGRRGGGYTAMPSEPIEKCEEAAGLSEAKNLSKDQRLRLVLVKQLEEIFARQRRIWGDIL